MDPKKKFLLFNQSKHFCAVPWNHIEIWSDGSVRTCSKGSMFGNINSSQFEDILQNNTIRQIKEDLLNNRANDNCTGCHNLTTANEHFDLRNHYNPMFKKTSVDYEDLTAFSLNGIDLHWDNTCNFKCVYCNSSQSSLIAQEQQVAITRTDPANINKIIDMIEKNQYQIQEIYLSGGEPLLIKHNAQLLSRIQNCELPIRINSNISVANESNKVFAQLKRFTNVLWTVSADSMGERFNYTRNGGNWEMFLHNLDVIKSLNHQIRLNLVWFVGSVHTFVETIRYFIQEHNITDITVNQLVDHEYLQARYAPASIKQQARNDIKELLDSDLIVPKSNTWYNIARCAKELDIDSESMVLNYKQYFDKLDQMRGTDWYKTFPELIN